MASARETALRTLMACQRQGAWSDGYLKKAIREDGLDRRDAALATRLCFGVLQNQLRLDWYLAQFSHIPLDKLEGAVLCSLRLALYQIQEMDRVPDSAAVNEAVKLTRKHSRNPKAAGLVNAVLRAYLRQRDELPEPTGKTWEETMSLRYSHPQWLVESFEARLGREGTEALLDADDQQPPTTVQVNALQVSPGQALESLQAQGVQAEVHPWLPGCLVLRGPEIWRNWKPTKRDGFTSRTRLPVWLCWRQDKSRAAVLTAVPPRAGSPLPVPSRWRIGARWCVATSTPTRSGCWRRARPGWVSAVCGPSCKMRPRSDQNGWGALMW